MPRRTPTRTTARTTTAPRLDPIRLEDLAEGFAGDLGARESVEGLRFTGLDLSEVDLVALSASECSFEEVALSGADLRGSSLVETSLRAIDAPVLRSPRSRWRDVVVDGSRIGSGELYESTWQSVHLRGCKLGYLNLRAAQLHDVLITDCTIDELDLAGATGARVAIVDSSVASIELSGATIEHLDLRAADLNTVAGLDGLRGAVVTEFQLALLAPLFAAHFGIRVDG